MSAGRPPLTWGTVTRIFEELEAAGFTPGDADHVARAILLLRPLAEVYSGQRDQIGDPPPLEPESKPAVIRADAGGWISGMSL